MVLHACLCRLLRLLLSIYLYDFCFLLLAPGPPNFFGSFLLASPLRRCLSNSLIFLRSSVLTGFANGWSFGSFLDFVQPVSALEIAVAAAYAWPMNPPPLTRTEMSTLPLRSPASSSGLR